MNNTAFQTAFAKAAAANGIDVDQLRSNEKVMMLCIDLYYQGCLDGIHKYSEALKEKNNVAVPTVPAPSV